MLTLLLLSSAPSPGSPLLRSPAAEGPVRPALPALLPEGVSEWTGSFTCAQGLTDLSLTITRTGEHLWATFAFGPLPENPGVPSGAFRMHGTVDGGHVELAPSEWLERPAHYVTVGLEGDLDPAARALEGVVRTPLRGCTTFVVHPEH